MIYFDNAATSWPKPNEVLAEMMDVMKNKGGNPGRGGHQMAASAAETVYRCRSAIASHFGGQPENVVFTPNTTQALNLSLKGLAPRGCHIVMSDLEHNAVCRPVYALARNGGSFSLFHALGSDEEILSSLAGAIRPETRIVVVTAASNICSTWLPINKIGKFCHERNLICIVDAAQCAGCRAFHLEQDEIDVLCAPGHKGLYGPQGSGFALFSRRINPAALNTILEGGSGTNSAERNMPSLLPDRLEAGTLSTPCIAGLYRGLTFVERIGIEKIANHERTLCRRLHEILDFLPGVTVYHGGNDLGAIVLFRVNGQSPEETAALLDEKGICVRAGLHCAPLAHQTLQTGADGAVRLSVGVFNCLNEADGFYRIMREIVKAGS